MVRATEAKTKLEKVFSRNGLELYLETDLNGCERMKVCMEEPETYLYKIDMHTLHNRMRALLEGEA